MEEKDTIRKNKGPVVFFRILYVFSLSLYFSFINIPYAFSLPRIDRVVSGEVEISNPDAHTLQINASDNTIINYSSFNLGAGERLIIYLPSGDSRILNRVTGGILSRIDGDINCNGIFVLVNPAGIDIGASGSIRAASLILSTNDITNENFLNEIYKFNRVEGIEGGYLINRGDIRVTEGGFGVLIGRGMDNEGIIYVPGGSIVMAGGDGIRLDISADGLISVGIEKSAAGGLLDSEGRGVVEQITSKGHIEGGLVQIKADALPGIFEKAINLEGVVRADRVEERGGVISIVASGDITSSADIEAEGGSIDLEGEDIVSQGSITADTLYEKGASFHIGGDYNVKSAYVENEDGAINLGTGNYSGETSDTGDIIIDPSAVITLTGDTTFRADSDTDGVGSFTMGAGSSVVGNYNLTLYSSENSDLRSIQTSGLDINESKAGSNPTYTSNNDIDVGSFTLNSGTFIAPSGTLSVSNDFTVASGATFNHNNGTVKFFINDTDYTIDADGVHFYNVNFDKSSGNSHTATINHDFTVEGDLTLTKSAANGYYIHTPSLTNVTLTVLGNFLVPDDGFSGETSIGTNDPSGNITVDLAGPTSSFEMQDPEGHIYSNVKFSGTGTQTINKTAGWVKYDITWTVDKPSGEVKLLNDFNFTSGDNYFYLNNGTLNLNGYAFSSINNFVQNGGVFDATTGSSYVSVGAFTMNGGTFNGGGASFNVTNGAFTQSAGTFNAPLHMYISNGMAVTGGTFNHNNGYITFYANDYDYTINVPYDLHFYNVEFHKCPGSSQDHTISISEGFIVDNDLTVRNLSTSGGAYTVDCIIPTIVVYGNVDFPDIGTGQLYFGSTSTHYPILRLAGANSSLTLSDPDVHLFSDVEFGGGGNYNVTQSAGSIEGGTWSVYNSSNVKLLSDLSGAFNVSLSSGTIDLGGHNLAAADFQQTGGTFSPSGGDVTVSDFTQTGGTFNAPSGYLNIGGNFSYTGGTFAPGTGTIRFTATDKDNTITTSGLTLNNVVFNGVGGEWSLQDDVDVGGDLTIDAGDFNLNGHNLTLTGSFSNTGTLKLEGGETLTGFLNDTDSGTIEYTGSGTYTSLIAGNTYYNLAVSGNGSFSTSSDLEVNGDFIQTAGTFNAPGGLMRISGDFTRTGGVFNHNNGTVRFVGDNQSITGSTTFYNLEKNTPGVLVFQEGATQTVEGKLTLKGADAGHLLSLRSSQNGIYWYINVTSDDYELNYLDVRDSYNTGGKLAADNSTFLHCIGWALPITEPEVQENTRSTEDADETISLNSENNFQEASSFNSEESIDISDNAVSGTSTQEVKGQRRPGSKSSVSTKPASVPDYRFMYVEGGRKYKKKYPSGKYRTTVVVFEGRVVAVPYTERGIEMDKIRNLRAGESAVQEGEVK